MFIYNSTQFWLVLALYNVKPIFMSCLFYVLLLKGIIFHSYSPFKKVELRYILKRKNDYFYIILCVVMYGILTVLLFTKVLFHLNFMFIYKEEAFSLLRLILIISFHSWMITANPLLNFNFLLFCTFILFICLFFYYHIYF